MHPATTVQEQHAIGTQLSLGLEVFLDLNPYGPQALRCRARLCGWIAGRYLIFEPANLAEFRLIRKSQPCAVRFFANGDVWGFISSILDPGAQTPLGLVIVHWPAQANRIRMRAHDRIQLSIPCQIFGHGAEGIPALLDDLSLGGCSIRSSHLFALQEEIRLSFQLPGCGAMEELNAVIRNVRKGPDRTILYGCQFASLSNGSEIGVYIANREFRSDTPKRPQVLVLTANEADRALVQRALNGDTFEVVVVRNLLELGFRLWTGQPAAIMVCEEQRQLSALEACRIIKASPGIASVPLIVYGGNAGFHSQAFDTGADLCLNSLEDAPLVAGFLGTGASAAR